MTDSSQPFARFGVKGNKKESSFSALHPLFRARSTHSGAPGSFFSKKRPREARSFV